MLHQVSFLAETQAQAKRDRRTILDINIREDPVLTQRAETILQ